MTVFELDPAAHHGLPARVAGREGVLSWGRNPAYTRRQVCHWWLIVPTDRFPDGAALSLQWSGADLVTLKEPA